MNCAFPKILIATTKVVSENQSPATLRQINDEKPEKQADQVANRKVEYDGIAVMQRKKVRLDGCCWQRKDSLAQKADDAEAAERWRANQRVASRLKIGRRSVYRI